jgi:RNA polymerase sigma-70 factor (ECF subfamily)
VRDDVDLLQAWRAGDRSAGETLSRRHYATVLRYFELNASWAADDLAQKTFMACTERVGEVRDAAAFKAYLMGIARRQLAMHQRDAIRAAALRSFDAPMQQTRLSTLFARNREQMLALRALASMPRRPQMLLILYYWDGVRTPELAASFGAPESTIRTRLARARDLLRDRIAALAVSGATALPNDDELQRLLTSVSTASAQAEAPSR